MELQLKPEQVAMLLQIINQASFAGADVEVIFELKGVLKTALSTVPQMKAVGDD